VFKKNKIRLKAQGQQEDHLIYLTNARVNWLYLKTSRHKTF